MPRESANPTAIRCHRSGPPHCGRARHGAGPRRRQCCRRCRRCWSRRTASVRVPGRSAEETDHPPEIIEAALAHGLRSSFRDWAAEETDHPARGHRGDARPCRCEPRRGGLPALGPVRAAAEAHGRLGRLSRWRAPRDGPVALSEDGQLERPRYARSASTSRTGGPLPSTRCRESSAGAPALQGDRRVAGVRIGGSRWYGIHGLRDSVLEVGFDSWQVPDFHSVGSGRWKAVSPSPSPTA